MSGAYCVDKRDGLSDVEDEGELDLGDDVVSGGAVRDAVVVRAGLLCDDIDNPVAPVCSVASGTPFPQVHTVLLNYASTAGRDCDKDRHRTCFRD